MRDHLRGSKSSHAPNVPLFGGSTFFGCNGAHELLAVDVALDVVDGRTGAAMLEPIAREDMEFVTEDDDALCHGLVGAGPMSML